MSNPNYTLEIISHHPQFKSKSLRKYYVDGIETVGAWGDEPFEVRFTNKTWQKIQVKLSIDGTDILTGKPANTEVSKDMWVVNAYATLTLKAWPEDNNGGAAFVFTSADNSVALHTHGDLSSRGIIAAAVFTEGHVEPIKVTPPVEHHHHHYPYWPSYTYPYYSPYWLNDTYKIGGTIQVNNVYNNSNTTGGRGSSLGGTHSSIMPQSASYNASSAGGETLDSYFCDTSDAVPASDGRERSKGLETLVSVGAGEHVDQKINYVQGLIKPMLSETVRVKYIWWDDLVAKLRTETAAQPQPSGFPGDKKQKNIDLGKTPRLGKKGSFRRAEVQEPVFTRF